MVLYSHLSNKREGWNKPGEGAREYFYSVIFEISDKQMQFAELNITPKQKKLIL